MIGSHKKVEAALNEYLSLAEMFEGSISDAKNELEHIKGISIIETGKDKLVIQALGFTVKIQFGMI